MQYQVIAPQSAQDWLDYYQLRYQVLRQPWGQPPGSEQDELETVSVHRMIRDQTGAVVAVGRLHLLTDGWCQVRYMAVAETARGKGFGALVLRALELQGLALGCDQLTLNARENAFAFYLKQGYRSGQQLPPLYGIAHQQMTKTLRLKTEPAQLALWCTQLQQIWHQTIPLSAFMQLQIEQFDGNQLICRAPLTPNRNLHQSMFAGSIYSILTLTGWGLVWLQLQAQGLSGDIVLADADIRYLAPVHQDARAEVQLLDTTGDFTALARGRRVRQALVVRLLDGERVLAEFHGRFVVLPVADTSDAA